MDWQSQHLEAVDHKNNWHSGAVGATSTCAIFMLVFSLSLDFTSDLAFFNELKNILFVRFTAICSVLSVVVNSAWPPTAGHHSSGWQMMSL